MVREPQGSRHAVAIELAGSTLQRAFGSAWRVRIQLPVALDAESEPEPDLAVVGGNPRDNVLGHPAHPVLIVEVADTSVRLDREHKAGLYARADIADYWIVNLVERLVEVYRNPTAARQAPFGWRYAERAVHGVGAAISPLAAPAARVLVADLLP